MEEPKNNNRAYFPILFAVIFIVGMFLGAILMVSSSAKSINSSFLSFAKSKYDKLNDVINFIENTYVDSINTKKLTDDAITSLLENLDPHSVYITAEEFNAANDPLVGSFEGIGVEFRIQKDTIIVMNVIAGGPADSVGLHAGDRIVKVDGKNVSGIKITNDQVMKKLKGKKGTQVKVAVFRKGLKNLLPFTIIRDEIPTYSLDIAYMLTSDIGYIKLSKFSATTHDEFVAALKKLKRQGLKKLVLDLRGNGGGYLNAAIDIADEFLENKKLIVYTKGLHRAKNMVYATDEGLFEKGELAVLIDEFSASASEIVTGAIQDNDRGTIIGRRSFGKGLVQEQINLADGSAIRLTVARYYTPTGRCIQKSYKNGTEDYYNDFYERFTDGELESADSIKFSDSLKFTTPKGKIVYGGGGIMPDIFVPLTKDENNKYYNSLFNKGLIYQYAFDYTDKNRKILNQKYKTAEEFLKNFSITDADYQLFTDYAIKNCIQTDEECLKLSRTNIKTMLLAYIGRNLFDDQGFYPIINKTDKTVIKAIQTFGEK
jgi:carboxyl-terminal processing protease